MKVVLKRLPGWFGAAAVLSLIVGAPNASAGTIGPNYCLPGSTATDCKVQLDIGNTSGGGGISPYPGPYVGIDITITGSHTLEFSLASDTQVSGATTYKYLFDNISFYLKDSANITGTAFVSASKDFAGST